jgi:hypothetical protein
MLDRALDSRLAVPAALRLQVIEFAGRANADGDRVRRQIELIFLVALTRITRLSCP